MGEILRPRGRNKAPLDTPGTPKVLWPHQTFMDWLERVCPEPTDPGKMTDRELLAASARRSVYLQVVREMEREQQRE